LFTDCVWDERNCTNLNCYNLAGQTAFRSLTLGFVGIICCSQSCRTNKENNLTCTN